MPAVSPRARRAPHQSIVADLTAVESAPASYIIDPAVESILDRFAVGKLLAKWQGRRKPLHENHVSRLWKTGVRGIPLPSLLVGNRRVSSVEACRWWTRAISAADATARGIQSAAVAPLTQAQEATLRRHGLGGVA